MNPMLKKRLKLVALIALFLAMSVLSLDFTGITGAVIAGVDISDEVQQAFDAGNEDVSVIVLLEDDAKTISHNQEEKKEAIQEKQEKVLKDLNQEEKQTVLGLFTEEKEFELQRQYQNINAFAGEITEEGLAKLRQNPQVESVVVNKIRHIFLSDSVPLINADDAWKVSVNGYNITGEGETACVVDTGIDYNHSALGGSFGNQVIAGYDFYNNDSDPRDDQGHGTHVAGIVASTDGTYKGVAPGAKLIAVKVCDSGGSCADADVLAGLEWCINNAITYNISVISISLGGGQYSSYCDAESDFVPYASVINDAVSKGINFVAATGNSGVGGIAGPACVQNATRVTATTKSDALASYGSRHSFFTDIIAVPGSSITSLNDGGGTIVMSGTSMAAPHVSGAIILMRQYWKLAYGKVPTPEQAEQKILATGKQVYDDSTNKNYARVDVLALLQPLLTFTDAPANGSVLNTTSALLEVRSDVELSSAVLELTYPNGSSVNLTMNPDSATQFSLLLSELSKGSHTYRVYGADDVGTTGASSLQILIVDDVAPNVVVQNPAANSILGNSLFTLSATAVDAHSSISTVFFNVSDGNISVLLPASGNGKVWSADINLSTLSEGGHSVVAYAHDTFGNSNQSVAVSFTVDITGPAITLLSPAANSRENSSDIITFVYNVTDEYVNVSNCSLNLNAALSEMKAIEYPGMQNFSRVLLNGDYRWMVECTDALGNTANSSVYSFEVSITNQTVELNGPSLNYLSSNPTVRFNCSASGANEQSSITLYGNWNGGWHANETLQLNGSSAAAFTKIVADGSYVWNCLTADMGGNTAFASANYSFTIDMTKPSLTGMVAENIDENSAEVSWTTNEKTNSSIQYGISNNFGTVKSINDDAMSHSITLSNLNSSTTYYYAATSCDNVANCNTSATASFTTEATEEEEEEDSNDNPASATPAAPASGASAAGGGGGSGGSSVSTETPSTDDEESEEALEALNQPEESESAEAVQETAAASPYSQTLLLAGPEPVEVVFDAADLPVKKVTLLSAAEKEVTVSVLRLLEKPEAANELDDVYTYLEITTTISEGELGQAFVTFTVPVEWLDAHNYSERSVVLQTYEGEEWFELETDLVSEDENILTYQAEVQHFSYFAITAGAETGFGSLITGLFSAIIPDKANTKEYVLFGLVLLTALLLVAYIVVSRRERYS